MCVRRFLCGRGGVREEPVCEAFDQAVQVTVAGSESTLTIRSVFGRETRGPIESAGAPQDERVRPALLEQRAKHLSYRNQTWSLCIDQSGVHAVSGRQEAVLSENLRAGRIW